MFSTKGFLLIFFTFLGSFLLFSQSNSTTDGDQKLLKANSLLKKNDSLSISISKEVIEKYGQEANYFIKSNIVLSIAYKNIGQYDTSLYYSERGIKRALEIADTINLIKLYSSRGVVHYLRAEYTKANQAFKKVADHYKKYGFDAETKDLSPLHYAKVLNNIATVYVKSGYSDSALNYFINSIKIREKYQAPKRMIAISKLNLGSIYLSLEDYTNSNEWIQKALVDAKSIKDSSLIGKCFINLGVQFKKNGDTLKAIQSYERSLNICKKYKNERDQAIVLLNLGLLNKEKGNYPDALRYLNEALLINQQIGANNAGIYLGLGELYFKRKKYTKSIENFNLAIKYGEKSGDISVQKDSYKVLYQLYKKRKEYEKSLQAYERYSGLREHTNNLENQKYIQRLKAEFESEQKESEIKFLKKLNETENIKAQAVQARQRITIITALLGILLMIVLFILFIIKRKKDRKLYQIEKQLLEKDLYNKELKGKEMQMEINYRTKQLTTHALNMVQRNQILTDIREKLNILSKQVKEELITDTKSIVRDINRMQRTEKDWELFKKYFEKVNKDFNHKLNEINPELSTHDYRLAALISLNLNIKETATVLNITPNSVKLARHRLRKKLALNTGDDLYLFLSRL